jgi:hypothetical protein
MWDRDKKNGVEFSKIRKWSGQINGVLSSHETIYQSIQILMKIEIN